MNLGVFWLVVIRTPRGLGATGNFGAGRSGGNAFFTDDREDNVLNA
jgi:hypothetical protein